MLLQSALALACIAITPIYPVVCRFIHSFVALCDQHPPTLETDGRHARSIIATSDMHIGHVALIKSTYFSFIQDTACLLAYRHLEPTVLQVHIFSNMGHISSRLESLHSRSHRPLQQHFSCCDCKF